MATTLQANNIFGAPLSQPTQAVTPPASTVKANPTPSTPSVASTMAPLAKVSAVAPTASLPKTLNFQPVQSTVTPTQQTTVTTLSPTIRQSTAGPVATDSQGKPAVASTSAQTSGNTAQTSVTATDYTPLGGGSAAEQNAKRKSPLTPPTPISRTRLELSCSSASVRNK